MAVTLDCVIEDARAWVRAHPGQRFTPYDLRKLADALDRESPPWPYSAERLRVLAEEIESGEKETTERLAKAGDMAAQALAECDRLRGLNAEMCKHITKIREDNDRLRRTVANYDLDFGDAAGTRDKAVAAAKVQRTLIDSLLSQMIELLSEHDDPDVEIVFSYGAHAGLTPSQGSDLALAFIDTEGRE
jgi:hypothetical protein